MNDIVSLLTSSGIKPTVFCKVMRRSETAFSVPIATSPLKESIEAFKAASGASEVHVRIENVKRIAGKCKKHYYLEVEMK